MPKSLPELQREAVAFRDAREWAQFHRPKDLALGLLAEAGELGELFLWRSEAELAGLREDEAARTRLGEEMADCLLFLLYLAEWSGIDLRDATARKLELNAHRYPVEKARGTARKYTDL